MLKSCPYCGGIHDSGHTCPSKPKRQEHKDITQADRFRWSRKWRKKRKAIQQRDRYLCRVCLTGKHNTIGRAYNFRDLQVHHIIPLAEDYSKRTEDNNLICLCAYHHAMAERGEIPREELRELAASPPAVTKADFQAPGTRHRGGISANNL